MQRAKLLAHRERYADAEDLARDAWSRMHTLRGDDDPRARSLSIALQGSNLGLWSDYRGLDPNVNGRAGSSGGTAVDMGVLPTPREWSVRISMGF